MRIIGLLLAIGILAITPVLGNTEILNLPSHPLCSPLSSTASLEAAELSKDWPVLRPGASPGFFAIQAGSPGGTRHGRGADGHWFRLALQEQRGVVEKGWTVRASWPANHHVSLKLDVYTPEEMLERTTSTGSQLDTRSSSQYENAVAPCSSLYLRLTAEVEGVPIPPSSLPEVASAQLHPFLLLLSTLASYYLDPLSATPRTQTKLERKMQSAGSDATTLTPIHLTLEPLLLGVAPRNITLHLLAVLVVIVAGVGTFVRAGGVEKVADWVEEVIRSDGVQGHGK